MEGFLGQITLFAGSYAPAKWTFCQGQLLQISGNEALFSLLGTSFGGDGRTTFRLPDYRGYIPVGQGIAGSGPAGSTTYPAGTVMGVERVTLTEQQIPAHNHPLNVSNEDANLLSAQQALLGSGEHFLASTSESRFSGPMYNGIITSSGTGDAHSNVMPTLCLNFIMCIVGTYPSRS
ncbi:phage tail protein [Shewanella sedimentimangrovi]|uniref:Phage tail protein n=1 Tax=Shewanella sedimentimangrovi TaxID=2814293 RepID=A0ABX7R294_9GAMM|nr:tail fiber protein [Shewanella sedimentimangrovi]QSX37417.1 phage tail protein [Shewanella sedimentimangrovi]